jgi:hypothetical protein
MVLVSSVIAQFLSCLAQNSSSITTASSARVFGIDGAQLGARAHGGGSSLNLTSLPRAVSASVAKAILCALPRALVVSFPQSQVPVFPDGRLPSTVKKLYACAKLDL